MGVRKYLGAVNLGLQENMEYRFNFFTTFIFILAPLIVHICLWVAVYGGGVTAQQMAGYTFEMMMTYTIIGHLLDKFTSEINLQLKTSSEIRDGLISRYLVKPVDYFYLDIASLFANRIVYFLTLSVPYLIVIVITRDYLIFNTNLVILSFFLLSLLMAILLSYMVNHLIGLVTFWLQEVTSLYVFTQSTFLFLAGGYFTLDLLPKSVYEFLMLTPFPYMLYFPITLYMGRYTVMESVYYLGICLVWIIFMFFLNKLVWKLGLKRYTADGI